MTVIWTDYMLYRLILRGFDQSMAEYVLRYSEERYYDTESARLVAIGKHGKDLVIIPYEKNLDQITPVTIHATTRTKVNLRIRSGRFVSS